MALEIQRSATCGTGSHATRKTLTIQTYGAAKIRIFQAENPNLTSTPVYKLRCGGQISLSSQGFANWDQVKLEIRQRYKTDGLWRTVDRPAQVRMEVWWIGDAADGTGSGGQGLTGQAFNMLVGTSQVVQLVAPGFEPTDPGVEPEDDYGDSLIPDFTDGSKWVVADMVANANREAAKGKQRPTDKGLPEDEDGIAPDDDDDDEDDAGPPPVPWLAIGGVYLLARVFKG